MSTVTLETLPQASAQGIFDTVVEGLAKQDYQRSMDGESCRYRAVDGKKCAVGQLMTNYEYDTITTECYLAGDGFIEGKSWEVLVDIGLVSPMHSELIDDLQDAHDSGENPRRMWENLKNVANWNSLNTKLLESFPWKEEEM